MNQRPLALALFFAGAALLLAADKKQPPAKADKPRILIAMPLGVAIGEKSRISLRGLKLDGAASAQVVGVPDATAKILSKSKLKLSKEEKPDLIGDSKVDLEVFLPPRLPEQDVQLTIKTPTGESPSFALFAATKRSLIAEKEPNDGFAEAQRVGVGESVEGVIQRQQDVDVFRFDAVAGKRWAFELCGRKRGSRLDPILTLFDAQAQTLATGSLGDSGGRPYDVRLEHFSAAPGPIFLCVQDANDKGDEMHVYRLSVKEIPAR